MKNMNTSLTCRAKDTPAWEDVMSSLIRPPVIRSALGVLDKSLFSRTVNLAAAAVHEKRNIAAWRQKLTKESSLLDLDRLQNVVAHPNQDLASQGTKCLLLHSKIKAEGIVRSKYLSIFVKPTVLNNDNCSA